MEYIIQELSKLLDITVEKATELYPILRQQFIVYKILRECSFWIVITILLLGISIPISTTLEELEEEDGYTPEVKYSRIRRMAVILIFVMILIGIALNISKYLLAPDFMIIKEFFK